jgi:hypothetical protein
MRLEGATAITRAGRLLVVGRALEGRSQAPPSRSDRQMGSVRSAPRSPDTTRGGRLPPRSILFPVAQPSIGSISAAPRLTRFASERDRLGREIVVLTMHEVRQAQVVPPVLPGRHDGPSGRVGHRAAAYRQRRLSRVALPAPSSAGRGGDGRHRHKGGQLLRRPIRQPVAVGGSVAPSSTRSRVLRSLGPRGGSDDPG